MAIETEGSNRSGTAAEWVATTLVLGVGEVGVATDTGDIRVGNGTDQFEDLPSRPPVRRGKATLVLGTVTVADAKITANSIIQLTAQSLGTVAVPKTLAVTARSNGVNFVITSADATDTSVVGYTIVEV